MKFTINFLFVTGILIAFSLVQFSCSSTKRSAVSCPDFSHSRNMKSRHVHSARVHHAWFKGTASVSRKINIVRGSEMIYSLNPVQATVRPASMEIPLEKLHASRSSAENYKSAAIVLPGTGLTGCDTVVMRNGDVMEAKVLEIGQREIRYRKCGDTQGPVFVVNIAEVFMIKYPGGNRDYFTSDRSPAPSMGDSAPKQTDGMAVGGFIGSLAGLFILGIPLGIMAIVFGFVSLGRINRHPEHYKGKGFATAGIVIGFIDIIGMLILLAAM
jgi:hypothetical protein